MKKFFIYGFIFILGFSVRSAIEYIPSKSIPSQNVQLSGAKIFSLVNDYRRENGLNPIEANTTACSFASERAPFILKDYDSGHKSLDEIREKPQYKNSGYAFGELLEKGAFTEEEAVKRWKTSMPHDEILKGKNLSIGCVYTFEDLVILTVGTKKAN